MIPCRYCSSSDTFIDSSYMRAQVECTICGSRGPKAESEEEAISLWDSTNAPEIYHSRMKLVNKAKKFLLKRMPKIRDELGDRVFAIALTQTGVTAFTIIILGCDMYHDFDASKILFKVEYDFHKFEKYTLDLKHMDISGNVLEYDFSNIANDVIWSHNWRPEYWIRTDPDKDEEVSDVHKRSLLEDLSD